MKICYFGVYNPNYSRNRILIKGLKDNGAEVIECRTDFTSWRKYWDLFWRHWKIRRDYDVMICGFPGNHAAMLAKLITRKPVVFDAFLSFYDSMVFDRKDYSPRNLKAWYYWLVDWLPARLSKIILLDTNEHIDYFVKTFKIRPNKFRRVFIGAEDGVFYPQEQIKDRDDFLVHFHASFIPLQGTRYIIDAAAILEEQKENIFFNIVGSGPEAKEMKQKVKDLELTNINFVGLVPYQEVPFYIAKSDICLGIFGDTNKTNRVIPNKIYECIAMKKPVITADTAAVREIFEDGKNLMFCRVADGQNLAAKILELKNNHELSGRLSEEGYELFKKEFCPGVLGNKLLEILSSLIKK